MLYSDLITSLRNQTGDVRRRKHVDWTGDGSLTIFQVPKDAFPIYDLVGTYTVKVDDTVKTEGIANDYLLDKQSGTLTLMAAPANGKSVTLDCSALHLTDTNWMQVINDVIHSLGDDFFKEFVDTTLTATAGMLSLSLATAQAKCIAIYEFQHRSNAGEDWSIVDVLTNWRFDRENNTIYIGKIDTFSASELLRVRGLKTYTLGTAITDTVDVQDRFMTIIEYGCLARYWRYRYKDVVELVSKETTENTRTALQELLMLVDRFDRNYESEKAKLKPAKPPRVIPKYLEAGGRP